MRLYAVKTRVIKARDNLVDVILESLRDQSLKIEDGDILALASKVVAYAENRILKLENVKASEEARKLADRFSLTPEFAELILREADRIYGGVENAVLTLKNDVLTANAGIDRKNTHSVRRNLHRSSTLQGFNVCKPDAFSLNVKGSHENTPIELYHHIL